MWQKYATELYTTLERPSASQKITWKAQNLPLKQSCDIEKKVEKLYTLFLAFSDGKDKLLSTNQEGKNQVLQ